MRSIWRVFTFSGIIWWLKAFFATVRMVMGKMPLFLLNCALSVSTTFSGTLFGPVLSLNSSESLNCNKKLSLMALDIFALFTLQHSMGFTDSSGIWTWKCGNSYKSRPGLDYCSCVYQHIIFLATFSFIRYEPFFPFPRWEQSIDWMWELLDWEDWSAVMSFLNLHSPKQSYRSLLNKTFS